MTRSERLAAFVSEHPGCTVTAIVEAMGCDGAQAWENICDAERDGLIRSVKPDGEPWGFWSER